MSRLLIFSFVLMVLLNACKTPSIMVPDTEQPERASFDVEAVLQKVPNYSGALHSVTGSGKAIISEPGNSERISLIFNATPEFGKIEIKNQVGIQGGTFWVDEDSILIYNRIDKIAQKLPVQRATETGINELASINVLKLLHYTVSPVDVIRTLQTKRYFVLETRSGERIFIDKQQYNISRVETLPGASLPYSIIHYEGFSEINRFILPKKITIFSADGKSKAALLLQRLETNPSKQDLIVDIPASITIERI